jgi:glycosyltransferase involved in cell wall biosynthesis
MNEDLRLGFISSYVPKKCGIATFCRDLILGIKDNKPESDVFVLAAEKKNENYDYDDLVVGKLKTNDRSTYLLAAKEIIKRNPDVLLLQHEFGLYGGQWTNFIHEGIEHHDPTGDFIFDILDNVTTPVITTLHTVLPYPDPIRKAVTKRIANRSTLLITMAQDSKRILCADYQIAENKIIVVPHGAPRLPNKNRSEILKQLNLEEDKYYLVITGLISPNKGIDIVINALPEILKQHPNVHLLVVGQTHPQIIAEEGESYRNGLMALIKKLKVGHAVTFINKYLETEELMEYMSASDIYLTIHRDPEQSASGTLAYAVGTGLISISTPYRYAQELLDHGRGFIVPFEDPISIITIVNRLIKDTDLISRTHQKLKDYGSAMEWPVVGGAYLKLIEDYVKHPICVPTTSTVL